MAIMTIDAFMTAWRLHFRRRTIFIGSVLAARALCAESEVTSREQFDRLLPGGLPNNLHYNIDRVSLELTADDNNCPIHSHGFFELKINSRGEVTTARDVSLSKSANLKTLTAGWVRNLLMQIHFKPLSLGSKSTSVHTFATVVCQ
jgi:hypothetical protein